MAFKVIQGRRLNRHRNCVSSCKDSVLMILVITLELTQHIAHAIGKKPFLRQKITRSQALARIADRTAKNCRGHVT